ncbi:hypothetical protein NCC78_27305 [Micromonospora phytophila]|uniref:hypothetical protein n=1 Tax=Micromonospora phytophila TaxID=709888 RepID=UPI00202E7AF0|nr:hypothetical protein [Micromonospora phytophila]MCM0678353.1 hypothetical protein [Micromonospora phytophila]
MSGSPRGSWAAVPADEERYRPLYARVLGLRFVNPGGVLCFLFFEGAVALAALLALAELVTWWAVLILPATVAVMVKLNDMVAAAVVRSAALVPEQERDRFRRQMEPVVGRARVEWVTHSVQGVVIAAEPVAHAEPSEPGRSGQPGARSDQPGARSGELWSGPVETEFGVRRNRPDPLN